MISAYASTSTAVEAMKWGAYDYLPKPFKVGEMKTVIRDALTAAQHRGVKEKAEEEPAGIHDFQGIVGNSQALRKIFDLIPRMAAGTSNVLITGESGTGK